MEGEGGKESETTNTEDPGESVSSLVGREQVGARGGCNQPQHTICRWYHAGPGGVFEMSTKEGKKCKIRFEGKENNNQERVNNKRKVRERMDEIVREGEEMQWGEEGKRPQGAIIAN